MKCQVFLVVFFLLSLMNFANNQDSLLLSIKNAKSDLDRIVTFLKIGESYENTNSKQSILWYLKAKKMSEDNFKKCKNPNLKNKYKYYFGKSIMETGVIFDLTGKSDSALIHFNQALLIFNEINNIQGQVSIYREIGNCYLSNGDFPKASNNYQKGISFCQSGLLNTKNKEEKDELKKSLAAIYNNSGILNYYQGKLTNALKMYLNAVKVYEDLSENDNLASAYVNVGALQQELNNNKLALEYFLKALEIRKNTKNIQAYALTLMNIGNAYIKLNDQVKANKYLVESLSLFEKCDDKKGISICCSNLSTISKSEKNYSKAIEFLNRSYLILIALNDKPELSSVLGSLADIYYLQNNYQKAIDYTELSLNMAKEIGSLREQRNCYEQLSKYFSGKKDYYSALKFTNLKTQIDDSLYSVEKNKQLTEMETKYQTEKKQQQILLQKNELIKKNLEATQQKIIRNTLIIGLIVVIFLIFLIFRSYRIKKKANELLAIKNAEITQQKEEIQTQRDLVVLQRDLISEQKGHITESIHYALRIQSAVIPSEDAVAKILQNFFILYLPRDIVSGDFYWISQIDNKIVILAADCTGHGVPGAFMSMLGVAFINEIVNNSKITKPNEILNHLRYKIIEALKKHGKEETYKDGMDVVAITIYSNESKIEYSGANNPLYLIKNNEIIEFKGNRMPVGTHIQMESFSLHEIAVNKNDCIYIFSDGYEDQFGGPKGKKFLSKNFKKLLHDISIEPMKKQKIILQNNFNEWKGNHEQVDDVMVLGVRI